MGAPALDLLDVAPGGAQAVGHERRELGQRAADGRIGGQHQHPQARRGVRRGRAGRRRCRLWRRRRGARRPVVAGWGGALLVCRSRRHGRDHLPARPAQPAQHGARRRAVRARAAGRSLRRLPGVELREVGEA